MNKYTQFRRRPSRKAIIGVLAVVIVLAGWMMFRPKSTSSRSSVASSVTVAPAKKSVRIDREFQFPIFDSTGQEVSRIKYYIESADLRDEIIVKGQKATAIPGRTFLVVTIKLTNDLESDIEINTRDYVRLQIDGSSQHLAADIHNDPVQVSAIATKATRLGFAIDDNPKQNFVLRVGEIKGYKEELPINF